MKINKNRKKVNVLENLNKILKSKNKTFTQLAKEMGSNRSSLYSSLKGNPTFITLKKVSDILNIHMESLLVNTINYDLEKYWSLYNEAEKIFPNNDFFNHTNRHLLTELVYQNGSIENIGKNNINSKYLFNNTITSGSLCKKTLEICTALLKNKIIRG